MAKSLIVLLIIGIVITLIGCSGPTNFQPLLYVRGEVWRSSIDTNEAAIFLSIYNAAGVPDVRANGTELRREWEVSCFEFSGNVNVELTDTLNISISYEDIDGEYIEAYIFDTIPGRFNIYCDSIESPEEIDLVINEGRDLYWTASRNVDYYHILYSLRYRYNTADTTNLLFSHNLDTTVTDTSFSLSSDMFTPDSVEIAQIYYFQGNIKIRAMAGPKLDEGIGNVMGDGIGFVRLYGWSHDIPFTISLE